VECFQNLDLSKQQEVIKALNIETGAKDACTALLQEDAALTEEKPEEVFAPIPERPPLPTPEEIPTPLEKDRPTRMVYFILFLYSFHL